MIKSQPQLSRLVGPPFSRCLRWWGSDPQAGCVQPGAWQIDPLTVIRGGYGIMYSFGLENGTYSGFDETTNYDASNNGGLTSSGYFASGTPFPSGSPAAVELTRCLN